MGEENSTAHSLMIQGTSSSVGKSLLTAALCRIYARRGYSVFPFKSQNMALNSFATPEGLEIGRAQALQAVAARREPSVDMNPILLKPEARGRSQVVVMGKPWKSLKGADYYRQKAELWQTVTSVLDRVAKENDLLIIEGAGSPAEINLKKDEIVNMRVAKYLNAPVLLAADIDRGGVFAFLYGTLELLEKEEQSLVKGFIINKFRGDISLLEPGLEMLANLSGGRKTVGVIPYMRNIQLAQEDSVFLDENRVFGAGETDIAVIHLPHISNYDDFDALAMEDGVRVRFVSSLEELGTPRGVIIPGTKSTVADLGWMRRTGLAEGVIEKAETGLPVAGICGGYQMLGRELHDPGGVEGTPGTVPGLGLLDLSTRFNPEKRTVKATGKVVANRGFLSPVNGAVVEGYEIHMGATTRGSEIDPVFRLQDSTTEASPNPCYDGGVSRNGKIWGTYLHGVFDRVDFRRGWLVSLGWKAAAPGMSLEEKREEELTLLADTVEKHLDMRALDRIIGL